MLFRFEFLLFRYGGLRRGHIVPIKNDRDVKK